MIPSDFGTFWCHAVQQAFRPKVVTIGKALRFPSVIESLGERGDGLSSEVWWSPHHPYKSTLTGASARDLAEGYAKASGRPWTQPIGYNHALFEVVVDVVARAADLEDSSAIIEAIGATDMQTIVGAVNWSTGPVPAAPRRPATSARTRRDRLRRAARDAGQHAQAPDAGQHAQAPVERGNGDR